MTARLDVGDIVKITKFGSWPFRENDSLWARVVEVISRPPTVLADIIFFAGTADVKSHLAGDPGPWSLEIGDKWVVVPDADVPDWVWVDAAQVALIGELPS